MISPGSPRDGRGASGRTPHSDPGSSRARWAGRRGGADPYGRSLCKNIKHSIPKRSSCLYFGNRPIGFKSRISHPPFSPVLRIANPGARVSDVPDSFLAADQWTDAFFVSVNPFHAGHVREKPGHPKRNYERIKPYLNRIKNPDDRLTGEWTQSVKTGALAKTAARCLERRSAMFISCL